MAAPRVGVVTGLAVEARIARRGGLLAEAAGGAGSDAGQRAAEALVARGATALASFGIAGGLAPALTTGSVVVASAVLGEARRFETDAAWAARLAAELPEATQGPILGVDRPLALAAQKGQAFAATGAVAVDMESMAAAQVAKKHDLPFAALRVIADPAGSDLPAAASYDEEGIRLGAVLQALARRPADLPALLALAVRTAAALRVLARCARILAATPPP